MFEDELYHMTCLSFRDAEAVALTWAQPPIIFQPVEEFGDQN